MLSAHAFDVLTGRHLQLLCCPGAAVWMDSMAAQLTTGVIAELTAVRCDLMVVQLLQLWDQLAISWAYKSTQPEELMLLLQPGLMQLMQRVALQLPTAAVSPTWARDIQMLGFKGLQAVTENYASLLEQEWQQGAQWWGRGSLAPVSTSTTAATSGSSRSRKGKSSSSSSSSRQGFSARYSAEQREALEHYQVSMLAPWSNMLWPELQLWTTASSSLQRLCCSLCLQQPRSAHTCQVCCVDAGT
jgi:hypothetical protein